MPAISDNYQYGTGRRKNAVARVFLSPGTGQILVNDRPAEAYFNRPALTMILQQPFEATQTIGQFDIRATIKGGGVAGQAGALRHGIAWALLEVNPDYRGVLRKAGLLTRDPRMVERKKAGRPGARKRFQFSKR